MGLALRLAESGRVPDRLLRLVMRRLCRQRLREECADDPAGYAPRYQALLEELRESEIAVHTDLANEQHYELPPEFFRLSLGKHLKYSSGLWREGVSDLDLAESAMLELYCERAGLADGQDILELGCGWGSLSLYLAERFPASRIMGVSNSLLQRHFIEARAQERGLRNLSILTADVNTLELSRNTFDRVLSIEMFEHMRNYHALLERISEWMRPGGALFVHIFCHREVMYPFQTEGETNWMGRYFFTGGLMPAADTLLNFQDHLAIRRRWLLSGQHYEKTANAWLHQLDQNSEALRPAFVQTYGDDADLWFQRWRMFYMACAELFGYDQGRQWLVGHYLFTQHKEG